MEKLTTDEVKHIAHLARIKLTNPEVEHFGEQLTSIIEYNANLLAEVDIVDVEPTSQTTGLENVWRSDEVTESLPHDVALSQAASIKDGQFLVKRVLEDN